MKKGKDVSVVIERQHLKVCYRGSEGEMIQIVDETLSWPINRDNSLWTLAPSEHVHVRMVYQI